MHGRRRDLASEDELRFGVIHSSSGSSSSSSSSGDSAGGMLYARNAPPVEGAQCVRPNAVVYCCLLAASARCIVPCSTRPSPPAPALPLPLSCRWTGIVTQIAIEMLESGAVEAVVCVQSANDDRLAPKPVRCREGGAGARQAARQAAVVAVFIALLQPPCCPPPPAIRHPPHCPPKTVVSFRLSHFYLSAVPLPAARLPACPPACAAGRGSLP